MVSKDPEESTLLQIKSKLSVILRGALQRGQYCRKTAALHLNCGPKKVKQILDGELHALSLDFLMSSLLKIGYEADLTYNPNNLKKPFGLKLKK